MSSTDLGTSCTYFTFLTFFSARIAVAFAAIGTMKALRSSTFLTNDHTFLDRTIITGGNTVGAYHTFFAPSLNFEIASSAFRTVPLTLSSAVHTKESFS